MILRLGLRLRNSRSRVGPSISGMTTSETTRSIWPSAFSNLFGREDRHEYLVDDRCRDAGAGIDNFDQHVLRSRHALGVIALALLGGDVGGAQREPAAAGHGITGIDRKVHDHLLELGN